MIITKSHQGEIKREGAAQFSGPTQIYDSPRSHTQKLGVNYAR